MTIQQLNYVHAVASEGHFGRAAQRCRVAQPTLSMQLKKLESELGAVLLDGSWRTSSFDGSEDLGGIGWVVGLDAGRNRAGGWHPEARPPANLGAFLVATTHAPSLG